LSTARIVREPTQPLISIVQVFDSEQFDALTCMNSLVRVVFRAGHSVVIPRCLRSPGSLVQAVT
jgi:hypothetical protein